MVNSSGVFFRQKMRCQTLPWHVSTDAYILPQKCDWHVAELRLAMPSGEENPRYEVDRGFHEKWHYSLWHEDFIWFHICHKVCEPVVLTSCSGLWHQGGVLLFLPGLLRRSVRFGLSGQLRPMESSADKRQVSDISDDASEKKFNHHSKHVKVRIKMYLWSCQEEGCRMFVDYQPDRLWCSWVLVTSGVDRCCFIWTTLWFSPLTLKTSGEVV